MAEANIILEWIWKHIVSIILGASVLIQITPIKLNPWSAIFKWLGKALNSDLTTKVDELSSTVTTLKNDQKENEKDRIRWEILEFANSCRDNRKHTKDEFQHIITLNDKYRKLLAETNDKNGVFDAEYQYISDLYKERQIKNDFL